MSKLKKKCKNDQEANAQNDAKKEETKCDRVL